MSRAVSTSPDAPPAVAPFRSILCGVDGSRVSAEAARQAAILAAAGARLTLLGVAWEERRAWSARATHDPHRLAAALETARLEARSLGVAPDVRLVESREATHVLLTHAADHDLLVLGASPPSRATGSLAGNTATAAVHSAPVPVLLARRPPDGVAFPSSILAAIAGMPSIAGVTTTAARLGSAYGARVSFVSAAGEALVAAAASVGATLVVVGGVSDSLAREAPCSVLVLRPRARAQDA
jgi:nucleotide-binding universal stress UspA family protein